MKLLTIGIKAKTWNDIKPFLNCDLEECEILVSCDPKLASKLQSVTNLRVITQKEENRVENIFCDNSTTDYLLVIKSGEVWSTEILGEVLNFVKSYPDVLVLKYIEGFYDTETRKSFVHEVNPATTQPFSLQSLFDGPKYFVPGIRFIWPVQIIKQMNILYDQSVMSDLLCDALFGIETLAAMYKLGNYGTLKVVSQVVDFHAPVRYSKPQHSDKYFESLLLKHEIWTANLWTKVSLRSMQQLFRKRISMLGSKTYNMYNERFNQDEL
jgi:hypothetical protein